MEKFDRSRSSDRYSNSSDQSQLYNSSGRHSRGGGAPFQPRHQDNYRGGRDSPHGYPGGFSSGGGGARGRENSRAFDSPPPYSSPPSGGGGGGVGGVGLRPIGDGIVGFRPPIGGGEGFGPMGGVGGFRPMGGGADPGGFRPMGGYGGDSGRFVPMAGGGGDGAGFPPMGGVDGGGSRRLGGNDGDAGAFRPMGGGGGIGAGFGFDNYQGPPPPLTGQKRGYPGRERSPGIFFFWLTNASLIKSSLIFLDLPFFILLP